MSDEEPRKVVVPIGTIVGKTSVEVLQETIADLRLELNLVRGAALERARLDAKEYDSLRKVLEVAVATLHEFSWAGSSVNFKARLALNRLRVAGFGDLVDQIAAKKQALDDALKDPGNADLSFEMPSSEEMKQQEAALRQTFAGTTSHQLARALLELPEERMVFVEGGHGSGTRDLGLQSLPWHHDTFKEVRVMVGDNTTEVSR